jgi:mannose-6-phosphate isomerase-like protein (cupin superfamily)
MAAGSGHGFEPTEGATTMTNADGNAERRTPVVLGPGEGRAYSMGPLSAVFKADGAESADRYTISEWWLDPHTKGPDPHSHPDDDVFFILGGTMSVMVDTEWIEADAGSFVLVPGDALHTFENRTAGRAGMLNVSVPGGFEQKMPGIAQWFRERPADEARA